MYSPDEELPTFNCSDGENPFRFREFSLAFPVALDISRGSEAVPSRIKPSNFIRQLHLRGSFIDWTAGSPLDNTKRALRAADPIRGLFISPATECKSFGMTFNNSILMFSEWRRTTFPPLRNV